MLAVPEEWEMIRKCGHSLISFRKKHLVVQKSSNSLCCLHNAGPRRATVCRRDHLGKTMQHIRDSTQTVLRHIVVVSLFHLVKSVKSNMIFPVANNVRHSVCNPMTVFAKAGSKVLEVIDHKNGTIILTVPTAQEYNNMWRVTQLVTLHIHNNYLDLFDWIVIADDDSYIIVDNLRLFLFDKDPTARRTYGALFKKYNADLLYNDGGGGIVMSAQIFKDFIKTLTSYGCKLRSRKTTHEVDVEIANCLLKLRIQASDTRDSQGRLRFSHFNPEQTIFASDSFVFANHKFLDFDKRSVQNWFDEFAPYKISKGQECCADLFIGFHQVPPKMMHVMDFLLYRAAPDHNKRLMATS